MGNVRYQLYQCFICQVGSSYTNVLLYYSLCIFVVSLKYCSNLHTSSLCTPNVLIFKRGALLREENGYWSVTKRDNTMLCFARVGA